MNLINCFFRSEEPTVARSGATATSLTIQKVIAQLNLAARAAGQQLWHPAASEKDVEHDLDVMLDYSDLRSIGLELLNGQTITYALTFEFTGRRLHASKDFDLARGLELPLLDRTCITSHRLLVRRRGNDSAYQCRLRLAWTDAATLAREQGSDFASEHSAAITGGRVAGRLHVGGSARHTVVVTQTGARGFAFGKASTLKNATVYLHERYAPHGFAFAVGRKVTAVLISSPRGIQARDIQPHNP